MPFGLGIFSRINATSNRQAAVPLNRVNRIFSAIAGFFGYAADDVTPVDAFFTEEEDPVEDGRLLNKRRSASRETLYRSKLDLRSIKNDSGSVGKTNPEDGKTGNGTEEVLWLESFDATEQPVSSEANKAKTIQAASPAEDKPNTLKENQKSKPTVASTATPSNATGPIFYSESPVSSGVFCSYASTSQESKDAETHINSNSQDLKSTPLVKDDNTLKCQDVMRNSIVCNNVHGFRIANASLEFSNLPCIKSSDIKTVADVGKQGPKDVTGKVIQTDEDLSKDNTALNAAQAPKKSTPKEDSQVDKGGTFVNLKDINSDKGLEERNTGEIQKQDANTCNPAPIPDKWDFIDSVASKEFQVDNSGTSAPLENISDIKSDVRSEKRSIAKNQRHDANTCYPAPIPDKQDVVEGAATQGFPPVLLEAPPLCQSKYVALPMNETHPVPFDGPSHKDHSAIEPAPLYQFNDEADFMNEVSPLALNEPSEKDHSVIEPAPLYQCHDKADCTNEVSPLALDEPADEDHSVIEPAPLYQCHDEADSMNEVSPLALNEPSEKYHSVIVPAPSYQFNDEADCTSEVSTLALNEPSEKNHSVIEPAPLYQFNDKADCSSEVSTLALDEPSVKDHCVIEPAPLYQFNDEADSTSEVSPLALDEPSEKDHSVIEPAPLHQCHDEADCTNEVSPLALDEPADEDHSVIEPAPLYQFNDEADSTSEVSTLVLDEPSEKDHSVIEPAPLYQFNDEADSMSGVPPLALDEPNEKDHPVIEEVPLHLRSDNSFSMNDRKQIPLEEPFETDSPALEVAVVTKAKEFKPLDLHKPRGEDPLSLDPAPPHECKDKPTPMDDTNMQPLPVNECRNQNNLLGRQPIFTDYGAIIKRLLALPVPKPSEQSPAKSVESQMTKQTSDHDSTNAVGDQPLFPHNDMEQDAIDNNQSQDADCSNKIVGFKTDELITSLFADESDLSLASIADSEEDSPLPTAGKIQTQLSNEPSEHDPGDVLLAADNNGPDIQVALPHDRVAPLHIGKSSLQAPGNSAPKPDCTDDNNNGRNIHAVTEDKRITPIPTSASNLLVPGNSTSTPDCNDDIKPEGVEHQVSIEPCQQHHLSNGVVQLETEETKLSAPCKSSAEHRGNSNAIKIPYCKEEQGETENSERQLLSSNIEGPLQDNPDHFQAPRRNQDGLQKDTLESKQASSILSTKRPTTDPENIPDFVAADDSPQVSEHSASAEPTFLTNSSLVLEYGNPLEKNAPGSPHATLSPTTSIFKAENDQDFEAQTTGCNQHVSENWNLPNTPLPDYEEDTLETIDDEIDQFGPPRGRHCSTPIPMLECEIEDPYGRLPRRYYNSTPILMPECEDEDITNRPHTASWMQHPHSPDMVSTSHSYTAIMPFGNPAHNDTSREEASKQGRWKKFKQRVRNTFSSVRSLFTRKSRRVAPLEEPMNYELEREMFLMDIDGQCMICYEADLVDDQSNEITRTIVPVGPYEPADNVRRRVARKTSLSTIRERDEDNRSQLTISEHQRDMETDGEKICN